MIKILAVLSFGVTQARLHSPRSLELSADKQAAIDLILSPPRLEMVMDDMEDIEDETLLQLCQGVCQSDEDCFGDLVCFTREEGEATPGCSVALQEFTAGGDSNFCAYPIAEVMSINDEGDATNDADGITHGLCQGNCASNGECPGDLICYFHGGIMDPVPGCKVANTEGVEGVSVFLLFTRTQRAT